MVKTVAIRTSSPCFQLWLQILKLFISGTLFLPSKRYIYCGAAAKVMWTSNIRSINSAQLEVITSYKEGMDEAQGLSISLMYRQPHMRLGHGILCLNEISVSSQALNLRKDGMGIKDLNRGEGHYLWQAEWFKAKLTLEIWGNCLNLLFMKVWGYAFIASLPHHLLASKVTVQKSEVSLWVSGPHSMQSEVLKVVLKWFNCLPILLPLSHSVTSLVYLSQPSSS